MSRIKMEPATLQRLIEDVDASDLSQSKKEIVKRLAQDEIDRRKNVDTFKEFHNWIKRGDQILNDINEEMARLKEITNPEADFISKTSVLEIIHNLYSAEEETLYDKGRNWILRKTEEEIMKLPTVK